MSAHEQELENHDSKAEIVLVVRRTNQASKGFSLQLGGRKFLPTNVAEIFAPCSGYLKGIAVNQSDRSVPANEHALFIYVSNDAPGLMDRGEGPS